MCVCCKSISMTLAQGQLKAAGTNLHKSLCRRGIFDLRLRHNQRDSWQIARQYRTLPIFELSPGPRPTMTSCYTPRHSHGSKGTKISNWDRIRLILKPGSGHP